MNIQTVHLIGYKAFDDITLELGGKSTVLYGINGVGKSSVLRAVNLLFSNIINTIVNKRFKQGIQLEPTDISFGKSLCSIEATIQTQSGGSHTYWRKITKRDSKRVDNKQGLKDLATDLLHESCLYSEALLDNAPDERALLDLGCNVPIFVNYGTNRLVVDVPLRIRNKHTFDQLSCFERAIENKLDFRTFFEWYRNQEDFENEKKVESKDFLYVDKSLQSVKMAVEAMLDGFTNLRVNRHPLSMTIKKGGKTLRIEQLSDGEKCTLAMFGDLARRLTIANPY